MEIKKPLVYDRKLSSLPNQNHLLNKLDLLLFSPLGEKSVGMAVFIICLRIIYFSFKTIFKMLRWSLKVVAALFVFFLYTL